MRILHLTNHLNPGGISSYIRTLANEMKRRGHQSSVLTSEGALKDHFQREGFPVFPMLPRTKSEIDPRLYFCLPAIYRFVKQQNFDILHAHTRVSQVVAAWIKLLTGIPYVTTCHAFCKRRLGRKFFPAWGNHVIAISAPVRNLLVNKFTLKGNKVTTVLNGIDVENLQIQMKRKDPNAIRKEWKIPENGSVVISTISRIVPVKGHEVLLAAIKRLIDRYPNLHLVITGTGSYQKRIANIVQTYCLDRHVTFTGALEDITTTMAVTDIFVSPVLWREAFGLSIVEAMALKIPVITTTSWELKDFFKDHESVLFAKAGDSADLAKALETLIIDKELRSSLAENAYSIIKSKFSAEAMGQEIEKLYKRIFYYKS